MNPLKEHKRAVCLNAVFLFSAAIDAGGLDAQVIDSRSNAVELRWKQSTDIPPGLENHYGYIIYYSHGSTSSTGDHIPHVVGQSHKDYLVEGLKPATEYSFKVGTYRYWSGSWSYTWPSDAHIVTAVTGPMSASKPSVISSSEITTEIFLELTYYFTNFTFIYYAL